MTPVTLHDTDFGVITFFRSHLLAGTLAFSRSLSLSSCFRLRLAFLTAWPSPRTRPTSSVGAAVAEPIARGAAPSAADFENINKVSRPRNSYPMPLPGVSECPANSGHRAP